MSRGVFFVSILPLSARTPMFCRPFTEHLGSTLRAANLARTDSARVAVLIPQHDQVAALRVHARHVALDHARLVGYRDDGRTNRVQAPRRASRLRLAQDRPLLRRVVSLVPHDRSLGSTPAA